MLKKIFATTLIMVLLSQSLQAQTTLEHLSNWRAHIIEKGNYAGVELSGDDYRSLVSKGPNILTTLFAEYEKENDPHVLAYYGILIHRVSGIRFFSYCKKPKKINGYEYFCDKKDLPVLSREIGLDGFSVLPYPERVIVERDQLVGFWKNRFKHLERNVDLDQVSFRLVNDPNQATEDSLNEIKKFNRIQYREFSKIGVYGVFNIPYYLDAIINSGNPVILCQFIKYYDKKKYREIEESVDFVVQIPKVSNMYKTKESRKEYVAQWWKKNKHLYTDLTDLYEAIDVKIKQF